MSDNIHERVANTTCQICGRAICSAKGVIAHHGYRRPGDGFQTASCEGARHLPYEVSCDAIPPYIKRLEFALDERKSYLEVFIANPPATLDEYNSWTRKTTTVERPEEIKEWKQCDPHSYEHVYFSRKYQITQVIRSLGMELEYLRKRLDEWYVQHPEHTRES